SPDYAQVLDDLASLLTRVAVLQLVSNYESDELFDLRLVKELAAGISAEDVQLYYQTAILGRRDLGFAPDPRTGFEMTLVRMLAFRPASTTAVVAGSPRAGTVPATGGGPAVRRAPAAPARTGHGARATAGCDMEGGARQG